MTRRFLANEPVDLDQQGGNDMSEATFNIGDVVYKANFSGFKYMGTNLECPCCHGTGRILLFSQQALCDSQEKTDAELEPVYIKCGLSDTLDPMNSIHCRNGKLEFSYPTYVVDQGKITGINLRKGNDDEIAYTYFVDGTACTRSTPIYATRQAARDVIDQRLVKTKEVLARIAAEARRCHEQKGTGDTHE